MTSPACIVLARAAVRAALTQVRTAAVNQPPDVREALLSVALDLQRLESALTDARNTARQVLAREGWAP